MRRIFHLKAALLAATICTAFSVQAAGGYTLFYKLPAGVNPTSKPTNPTDPSGPSNPTGPTSPGGPSTPETPVEPLPDDVHLTVAPTTDFGRIPLNKGTTKSIVFTAAGTRGTLNLDTQPYMVSSTMTANGPGEDCFRAVLSPGQSCTATVVMFPSKAGLLMGTLSIRPQNAAQATSIDLTAEAINPVSFSKQPLFANLYSTKQAELKPMVVVEESGYSPSKILISPVDVESNIGINAQGEVIGWIGGSPRDIKLKVRAIYEENFVDEALSFKLDFKPLSGVTSASTPANAYGGCAISSGQVYCWGLKNELLAGASQNPYDVLAAVPIPGLPTAKAVSNGTNHACAVSTSGDVWCWGRNTNGEIGSSAAAGANLTPVQVTGFAGPVKSVAIAGGTNCAVLDNGMAQCWGQNEAWGAGLGHNSKVPTPTTVPNAIGALTSISGASGVFCGITTDNRVGCWGYNVRQGLGQGHNSAVTGMVAVKGPASENGGAALSGMSQVSVGAGQACAVGSGRAYCWGANEWGQLGYGVRGTSTPEATQRVTVMPIDGTSKIAALNSRTCASNANSWQCWGGTAYGALGIPASSTPALAPITLPLTASEASMAQVFGGMWNTCVYIPGGSIKCMGDNNVGSMGLGNKTSTLSLMPVVH